MAELVSVRHSSEKDENVEDKTSTAIAIKNPAYSNDVETAPSTLDTNCDVVNSTDKVKAIQGTTITFRDLIYTVDIKVKRKKVKKEIVKGIRYVVVNVNNGCKTVATSAYEIYHNFVITI